MNKPSNAFVLLQLWHASERLDVGQQLAECYRVVNKDAETGKRVAGLAFCTPRVAPACLTLQPLFQQGGQVTFQGMKNVTLTRDEKKLKTRELLLSFRSKD